MFFPGSPYRRWGVCIPWACQEPSSMSNVRHINEITCLCTWTYSYFVPIEAGVCPLGIQLENLSESRLGKQLIWVFLPDFKDHNPAITTHSPEEAKQQLSGTFSECNYQRLLLSDFALGEEGLTIERVRSCSSNVSTFNKPVRFAGAEMKHPSFSCDHFGFQGTDCWGWGRLRRGRSTDPHTTHTCPRELKHFKVPFYAFNSKMNTFQGDPILKWQTVFQKGRSSPLKQFPVTCLNRILKGSTCCLVYGSFFPGRDIPF